MSWNYRVVITDDDGEEFYSLHEAYYDAGAVADRTEQPCGFVSESLWGLRLQMWRALLDTFRRPPIDDGPRYTLTDKGREMLKGRE